MRYIISTTQAHTLIFKFLDNEFSDKNFVKNLNPYVKDGNTYTVEIFNNSKITLGNLNYIKESNEKPFMTCFGIDVYEKNGELISEYENI